MFSYVVSRMTGLSMDELVQSRQARGLAGSLALRIAERLLRFIMAILLARLMGPEEFGLYMYALSWVLILIVPALAGASQFVNREIAVVKTEKDNGTARGLVRWSTWLVWSCSILVMIIAMLFVNLVPGIENETVRVFNIALMMLPFVAMIRLLQALLRGWGNVIQGQVVDLILRPVLIIVFAAMCFVVLPEGRVTAETMFAGYMLAVVICTVVAWWIIRFNLKSIWAYQAIMAPRKWTLRSLRFILLSGLSMVNARVGVVMVGLLAGNTAAGLFMVAVRGAELIAIAVTAANFALAPRMASLFREGNNDRLQTMLTRAYRGVVSISLPILLLFILFSEVPLMLFGSAYRDANSALIILSVGQFLNAVFGPAGTLLNMTYHETYSMIAFALSIVLNVALNILLIPMWGITGASVAAAVALVSWNLVLAWVCWYKLGLWTSVIGPFRRAGTKALP